MQRQGYKKKSRFLKKYIVVCFTAFCFITSIYFWNKLAVLQEKFINITGAYIKTVSIMGASPKVEKLIRANLGAKEGDSIFSVSTTNMLKNLSKIGWIKEATIHKILPNIIKIKIVERIPIAVYYHDKKYNLIDADGILIEETETTPGLPIISGSNANIHAKEILSLLSKFPRIKVHSLMYVQNRRWNVILDNKITVKLPAKNLENMLKLLSDIIDQPSIKNAVTGIDLRVNGNVIVQGLSERK